MDDRQLVSYVLSPWPRGSYVPLGYRPERRSPTGAPTHPDRLHTKITPSANRTSRAGRTSGRARNAAARSLNLYLS